MEDIIAEISLLEPDSTNQFEILRMISSVINEGESESFSRELVLRVLDQRKYFEEFNEIIDALVREVGLLPYIDEDTLSLRDSLAYEFFKPLNDDGSIVFHRAQADVYHKLISGENVILSAPTSFGKSKIVDSIIELNRYENIAVVVPTIALIDETRRRLSRFSGLYKIVTQITQEPANRNIFIFTAERLNAYGNLPKMDFFVVDEFYKIGALDRDEERAVSLNQAFYKLFKMGGQFYLLGPNIQQIPDNLDRDLKCNFYNTSFSTVVSEVQYIQPGEDELDSLMDLLAGLDGQTLVYCKSPNRVNKVAHKLLERLEVIEDVDVNEAAEWIEGEFHEEWVFPRSLRHGVALHHGRLPRSLAQVSVKLFNDCKVKFLLCTSTLIEGVNTSAKNIVIFDHKIGNRRYDFFTFNNIKGRGGRMFQHFIGHVYIFNAPPQEELPFVDFPFYSQGENVPESLLIQLDKDDLKETSKQRLSEYFDQRVLPIELIRFNSAVNPNDLINLAKIIDELGAEDASKLIWDAYPKYKQLEFCCDLIWEHLVSRGKAGIVSPKQLTLKIFSLYKDRNLKNRIADELKPGQFQAKDADEAVERILDFDRNWAGYTFPRLLMILDSIQEYILRPKFGSAGDYSFFAANVESFFGKSSLIALEEFGLPIQIGEKVDAQISISENIDLAISQLRGYEYDQDIYTHFEKHIIEDVKEHI